MDEKYLEKLMKIAHNHKKEVNNFGQMDNLNDAQKFILTFKIKAGKVSVSEDLIYEAYSLWIPKGIARKIFFKNFIGLLPKSDSGTKGLYNLNMSGITLLEKVYDLTS